ncbi:hypothetical protein CEXT_102881 [Caerostris extrusa]|uniref:Uncharacterized protein n=1 Tax=Caerostris extrusa TaxID=172846 RepID=A0AAV4PLT0_CAEEX|nr:hypothetical protein CEXT_102881 [Caerostris extrusa]
MERRNFLYHSHSTYLPMPVPLMNGANPLLSLTTVFVENVSRERLFSRKKGFHKTTTFDRMSRMDSFTIADRQGVADTVLLQVSFLQNATVTI